MTIRSTSHAVRKLRDKGLDEATAQAIIEVVRDDIRDELREAEKRNRADLQDIEERNRADIEAVEKRNSAHLKGELKVVEAKNLAEIQKALFYFFITLVGGASIIAFILVIAYAAANG